MSIPCKHIVNGRSCSPISVNGIVACSDSSFALVAVSTSFIRPSSWAWLPQSPDILLLCPNIESLQAACWAMDAAACSMSPRFDLSHRARKEESQTPPVSRMVSIAMGYCTSKRCFSASTTSSPGTFTLTGTAALVQLTSSPHCDTGIENRFKTVIVHIALLFQNRTAHYAQGSWVCTTLTFSQNSSEPYGPFLHQTHQFVVDFTKACWCASQNCEMGQCRR